MYDLCVNSGKEVTPVEDDSTLSVVQPGTTVVMRIVLVKQAWRSTINQRYVTCPGESCGARTEVDDELGASSIEWCVLYLLCWLNIFIFSKTASLVTNVAFNFKYRMSLVVKLGQRPSERPQTVIFTLFVISTSRTCL